MSRRKQIATGVIPGLTNSGPPCVAPAASCGTPYGWRVGGRCPRCRTAHNQDLRQTRNPPLTREERQHVLDALRAGKTEAEAADLVGRNSRLLRLLASQDGELRSALAGESPYAQSLARMADYLAALVRQEGYETLAAREIGATPEELGAWMGIPGFAPLQELLDAVLGANRRQWEEYGWQNKHQVKAEQDAEFTRMWNEGVAGEEIAQVLGWKIEKVYSRVGALGLARRYGHRAKPIDKDTLVRLWQDKSLAVREIAKRLEVSVPTVTRHALAHGLPPRGRPKGNQPTKIDEKALALLWADNTLTLAQIAKQMGVSIYIIVARAEVLHLPKRKSGRWPASPRT